MSNSIQFDGLEYPITIVQGDTFDRTFTVSTVIDGVKTPLDFTGQSLFGYVRPTFTTGTVVQMTATIVDATAGVIRLQLSSTQTNTMPSGALQYQVYTTIPASPNIQTTRLKGNFVVNKRVQTT